MNCVVCEEVITNPLCSCCLHKGVRQWLLEQGHKRMAEEARSVTSSIIMNDGETFCIKCNSLMSLCTYCYTKEMFNVVKKQPELMKQFLTYFNFDLEHLGWEIEARSWIQ